MLLKYLVNSKVTKFLTGNAEIGEKLARITATWVEKVDGRNGGSDPRKDKAAQKDPTKRYVSNWEIHKSYFNLNKIYFRR